MSTLPIDGLAPTEATYEEKLTQAKARRKQQRRKVVRAMVELEKINCYVGWLDAKIAAERDGND